MNKKYMTSLNRPRSSIFNYHHLISKLSDEDIRTIIETISKNESKKNTILNNKHSDKMALSRIIKKILRYWKCQ